MKRACHSRVGGKMDNGIRVVRKWGDKTWMWTVCVGVREVRRN